MVELWREMQYYLIKYGISFCALAYPAQRGVPYCRTYAYIPKGEEYETIN